MLISKATGSWGDGADEATFNLEAVGNTPAEVEHFRTLVGEATSVSASFDNGAFKISLNFKRRITLAVQAALKDEADAQARDEARKAAQQRALDAEADAAADHEAIANRAAEILAEKAAALLAQKK